MRSDLEKIEKERKAMEFKKNIDVLKSKLILLSELKEREEFRKSGKKLTTTN